MNATKSKKVPWPPGKPLPRLATRAEEERFWLTHDLDAVMDADGEPAGASPTEATVDTKGR